MRSGKLSCSANILNGKRYHQASLRTFLAGLAILILGILPLRAQTDPNLENGFKPYGTYSGSNIDSINLENGNLILHIPMPFGLPQRGKAQPSYSLNITSKLWSRACGSACSWFPSPTGSLLTPTGVGFDNQFDLAVTRSTQSVVDTGGAGLPSTYVDMGVDTLTTSDGAAHKVRFGVTSDLTGYLVVESNPDANGIDQTVTIHDRAGNVYSMSPYHNLRCLTSIKPDDTDPNHPGNITTTTCTQVARVSGVTDSNGNQITFGGQDTMGRTITAQGFSAATPTTDFSGCVSPTSQPISSATLSTYTGFNGATNQIKVCYTSLALSTDFQLAGTSEYPGTLQEPPITPIVSVVFLADNSTWSFQYDSYGNVTYVGLPLGGSIQYQWGTHSFPGCPIGIPNNPITVSRAVTERIVTDNNGNSYIWKYQYGTAACNAPLTNTITDPLGNDTVDTFNQLQSVDNGANDNPAPFFVTTTQVYQGPQGNGTLLKQEDFQYYSSGGTGNNQISNGFVTQVTTTINGNVSRVTRTPDAGGYGASMPNFGLVTVEKKYDFGPGSPGALLSETDTSYAWQGTSTTAQNYLAANLIGLPSSVQVKDANGNVCAETDNGYDEPGRLTGFLGAIPSHVAAPSGVRGNLTSSSRKLSATACSIGTTTPAVTSLTNWYDTGEVFQAIDPLGNTTTHTYDLAYDGAYSTQTCNAASQCVSGTYDFNTGLLTSFTNANATTQASGTKPGDSAHTTLYSYDVLSRLTTATFPPDPGNLDSNNNGEQATTQFTFPMPLTLPFTVTRTKSVTAAKNDTVTTTYDGLGRVYQTVHNTAGSATVVSAYDGLDHVTSVTNPYFSLSDPTYGSIQTQYDALGRVTQTTLQDGGLSKTDYSNFPTVTSTDPAGKVRGSRTDALGRLVEVDEPGSGVNGPGTSGTGSITISGSLQTGSTSGTKATGWFNVNGADDFVFNCGPSGLCGPRSPKIWDSGWVTVTVNGVQGASGYGRTSNQETMAESIASQLTPVSVISDPGTGTITIQANVPGPNYSLSATAQSNDPNDFGTGSFTVAVSGPTLTGGVYPTTTYDSGNLTVTVNGFQASAPYNQNTNNTATALASALTSALNASGSPVTATVSGATITMTANAKGASTNYSVSGSSTASFTASSTTLAGGTNPGGLNTPYVTKYTYDILGNLMQVNQLGDGSQAARVRSFSYDTLSRVLTSQNPESGLISYAYDADGNMLQRTAPAPNALAPSTATQTVSYCYDALNRVTRRDYSPHDYTSSPCPISAPVVKYAYDTGANAIGHLSSVTDQAGTAGYTYDVLGRMTQESRTITAVTPNVTKSVGYGYNLNGSLSTLTYPSGAIVTYTPDAAGRDISAVDTANNLNYVTGVTYGPDGITGLINGGTISSSFSYNPRLQPCRITATTGTLPANCTDPSTTNIGTVFDVSYDYHVGNGDDGNVFAINNNKDSTRSQSFAYDQLNRLISAYTTGTNCSTPTVNGKNLYWSNSYGYDPWGNLLSKTPTSPCPTESLSVTALTNNQIMGYTYDIAGNITNDGTDGVTATFDAENRIATATRSSATTTYVYDANGGRVIKSNGSAGTIYWHSAVGVVAESDLSGIMQHEYIFFGGQRVARKDIAGNTVAYYFADHLQRTSIVTDATGRVTADSDYYPFGGELQVVNNDSNDYKFTGKKRDIETGLDYFGARYYSSGFGRFVTPDWSAGPATVPYAHLDNPQTLNLYSYVDNNPTNEIDADGHSFQYMVAPSDSWGDIFYQGVGISEEWDVSNDLVDTTNIGEILGAQTSSMTEDPALALNQAACAVLPDGRMNGLNLTPGLLPFTGSAELVANYNTGEVGIVFAGGGAMPPIPALSGQQGWIFNLPSNKDYSGGFTTLSLPAPLPVPGLSVGMFVSWSSGGFQGMYDGGGPRVSLYNGGAYVVGTQVSAGLKGFPTWPSTTLTTYSNPHTIGYLNRLSFNPLFGLLEGGNLLLDLANYWAKQECNKSK